MFPVISPLNGAPNVRLLKRIRTEDLVASWRKRFNIDITSELEGSDQISLYECNETKLRFFTPRHIAGTARLYEALEKHDWYYMSRKWEHDVAVQELADCRRVLEIGCGRGDFLLRLSRRNHNQVEGIEINSSAIQAARRRGLRVFSVDLLVFAQQRNSVYDAVCAFQVLEHTNDPYHTLQAMLRLVKPKGNLIISVPNSNSFLKHASRNLLNLPPHHMTQWREGTFQRLAEIFPVRVSKIAFEPLAKYHIDWYISIQKSRIPFHGLPKKILSQFWDHLGGPLLQKSALIRNHIAGHTLYVSFVKTGAIGK
jgi:2-polyprenyl-3-methyl-5-hydroxy-6-metoxy-1,4-benzoquinol methylase